MGVHIMQRYNWTFPSNPNTVEFDTATDGFTAFLKGIQHVALYPDSYLAGEFAGLNGDWLNVLRFLASMYGLKARSSYRRAVVECVHLLWKLDAGFRELLERHVRQASEEASTDLIWLPWLDDDEWKKVYNAEAVAATEMQMASTTLVRHIAPNPLAGGGFFGCAVKCFRCGKRLGYACQRKGFGWRQRTHDARCLQRMQLVDQ